MIKHLGAMVLTLLIATGAMAAPELSQLQLKVKSGLDSIGLDVSDEQIIAASSQDLATVVAILEGSGERPDTPEKQKAKIRVLFGD